MISSGTLTRATTSASARLLVDATRAVGMPASAAATDAPNSIDSRTIRSGFQDRMMERSPGNAAGAFRPTKISLTGGLSDLVGSHRGESVGNLSQFPVAGVSELRMIQSGAPDDRARFLRGGDEDVMTALHQSAGEGKERSNVTDHPHGREENAHAACL